MSVGRFDETGIQIPHTWEELKALQKELGEYGGATRLREDQEYYDLYQEVFPREKILELLRRQMKGQESALIRNYFPYSRITQYLPAVRHYLAWSTKGPLSDERVKELVEEKFPNREWVSFETITANKSVPEIWHVHVFVNDQT